GRGVMSPDISFIVSEEKSQKDF
ncbi:unnamed protein product, partial [Oikopleura dioica]